jgi:SpoVK/Ycf46/Vps4 family AAA+-type ATPase
MLTKRSSEENESARRVKTEFLIQLDGVGSGKGRILVIGATNRPFDLDEAALRRLTKRIYIGLPDAEAREGQVKKLLGTVKSSISTADLSQLVKLTERYSSADLTAVVKDAAMAPLRDLPPGKTILNILPSELRPVTLQDFLKALKVISPSVSP